MTNKEILQQHIKNVVALNGDLVGDINANDIVKAMDQFAKHQATKYDKWKIENNWEWSTSQWGQHGKIMWLQIQNFEVPKEYLTSGQLYELFLKSK